MRFQRLLSASAVIAFSFSFIAGLSLPSDIQAQTVYTWQQCVDEAKNKHPDLISAREGINQSEANKTIMESGLFPQIDSGVSAASSKSASADPTEKYSYGLTGSQLLFDGFKTAHQIKEAQQNLWGSQFSYRVISSNVRLRLRNAFIQLLKEQGLSKITSEIAARRQESLKLVGLRYEAGREHKGALLTAKANLAQAEAEVSQAQRNLTLAQWRLSKEMGGKQLIPIQAQGDFEVTDSQPEQPDFEQLAETVPFLRELIARKEAAKYGLRSAKADYFPEVFADANISRSESRWPPGDESWSAGIRMTLPIFDGGNRKASVKKAESFFAQAKAQEHSGRDGVILTLHEAWVRLQDTLDNIQVQKKFRESAEVRAKIGEAQYSNGLISFDDWIIIEDALVRTKKSFLEAQADALTAEASWIQAKGRILDDEI